MSLEQADYIADVVVVDPETIRGSLIRRVVELTSDGQLSSVYFPDPLIALDELSTGRKTKLVIVADDPRSRALEGQFGFVNSVRACTDVPILVATIGSDLKLDWQTAREIRGVCNMMEGINPLTQSLMTLFPRECKVNSRRAKPRAA